MIKLFLLFAVAALSVAYKDYTGHRLVVVTPNVQKHLDLIRQWSDEDLEFSVWKEFRSVHFSGEVLLSPTAFEKYRVLFNKHQITYSVVNEDIQETIQEEKATLEEHRRKFRNLPRAQLTTYPRFADIQSFLTATQAANTGFTSIYSAGQSIQGRDLNVFVIKVGNPPNRAWFDCGIHAREWISPVTCLNVIDKLITDYKNGNADVVNLLNKYEIHVLPSLNPDGYEYSHTTDRYWRKNRRVNTGSTCVGVDLNRNFGYQWNPNSGASGNPCSDTYNGVTPDSEPETKAIQSILKNGVWKSYISIHSYGMWYLLEWGWTTGLPSVYNEQKRVADLSNAAAVAVNGQSFTVGSTANLLYIATGASADYALGALNITYSYTLELRPKGSTLGLSGFNLNANQIPAVADETYAAIKEALKNFQ